MMSGINGEAAYSHRAIRFAVRHADLAHAYRTQRTGVAIEQLAVLMHDGFGKFIHRIGSSGCMHPADVLIEALVDKELSPSNCTVRIEPCIARHLQFRAEIEGCVRIDQQQCVTVDRELGCNGDAVRAGRLGPARWSGHACCRFSIMSVKVRQGIERHTFDIAADTAFAETQCHPRLEALDHTRMHIRMRGEVIVQAVGPCIHQRLEPAGTCGVLSLQLGGVDKQLHTQIAPDRRLTFGLGETPHGVEVIGLDAIEVVFRLRVGHAEYGVGIRLAVHVGDAPVVARDGDGLRLMVPARRFGRVGLHTRNHRERKQHRQRKRKLERTAL